MRTCCPELADFALQAEVTIFRLCNDVGQSLGYVEHVAGIIKQFMFPGLDPLSWTLLHRRLGASPDRKNQFGSSFMDGLDLLRHDFCRVVAAHAAIDVRAIVDGVF